MKRETSINPIIPSVLTIGIMVLSLTSDIISFVQHPIQTSLIILVLVGFWLFVYFHNRWVRYKSRIFCTRDDATPFMKKDLKRHKHIGFVGVSHTSLARYLQETINDNKGNVLPWESVTVYFANNTIGEMWEKESFEKNIRDSKIKIAGILFSESNYELLKNLKMVNFKQNTYSYNFSGCFCGNTDFDEKDSALQVIYSVNSLPVDRQTQKSWTIRVERKTKKPLPTEKHLFNELEKSFLLMNSRSIELGKFAFSAWEWSFKEWNAFASEYNGFQKGIDAMISTLDLQNKNILEVGAGTGYVSKYLLNKFPNTRITLIDNAANMLSEAKVLIGEGERATYELFSFPLKMDYYIKKNEHKYDYIISHLSLQSIASNPHDLFGFASNCNRLLKEKGSVLIALHNAQEVTIKHKEKKEWNDAFKHDIINGIKNRGLPLKKTHHHIHFNEDDLIKAFLKKGFKKTLKESYNFEINMFDRRRLWDIPAVLDSLIDIKQIKKMEGKEIVKKAYQDNIQLNTMDRYILVVHFQKR